ncbi:flagellar hook-associated protein FlgK [Naasia sp. SYSU D00057]|uniref:flagellar hook-associated protein FlgK n=1 Tax=Naasia sp. SYSU D00057 TaxID=2817380 RepID=UPI001B3139FF|nr:flagellar hook-associated protein FlgK [Naasia sp. SYSU D00057]
MSTFGALHTAYSGLQAARAGMDVTGQNVANATTAGYTRQRVSQAAVGSAAAASSVFRTGVNIGQGVQVTGVDRLSDSILDTRVRSAASTAGYWSVTSAAVSTIETSLKEPGTSGLPATLASFWASWQNLANNPGSAGHAATVLTEAGQVASRIAAGYSEATAGWDSQLTAAKTTVATINDTAAQVARLNEQIRRTVGAGGSANELRDQRDLLVTDLARLTGATVRDNGDSTVDVLLGGSALVAGTTSRTLAVAGAARLEEAATSPVRLEWKGEGRPVDVEGGALAAHLALLAPADGSGGGGPWAEEAAVYNSLATGLAETVNLLHQQGDLPDGTSGASFFGFSADATVPAALGLTILPTGVSGIAAALPDAGGGNGGMADRIAGLGRAPEGPDAAWAAHVVQLGVLSRTTAQQASLGHQALATASGAQASQAAVDLDEETTNLLVYQHAYQGAARVMTAIDEMLDVLINRTGIVGR